MMRTDRSAIRIASELDLVSHLHMRLHGVMVFAQALKLTIEELLAISAVRLNMICCIGGDDLLLCPAHPT